MNTYMDGGPDVMKHVETLSRQLSLMKDLCLLVSWLGLLLFINFIRESGKHNNNYVDLLSVRHDDSGKTVFILVSPRA